MQEVQLYISGERVDLFKDESISLTSSIQNVRDISKVFSDFSQTFSLPASKTNNKIFEHWYNYSIDGGFDARYRVEANIELNFLPFRKGKIRLESVKLKEGKPFSYNVTFFGETITLKDLLGDDLLSDMNFSDYSVPYNGDSVADNLQTGQTLNGITDAIICPLISSGQRYFYQPSISTLEGNLANTGAQWNSMKYAIKLHAIIKKIESTYGITFSTDFFNSSNSDWFNLFLWLQREEGVISTGKSVQYLERWTQDYTFYGFATLNNAFTINDVPTSAQWYNVELSITVNTTDEFDIVLYKDGNEFDFFTGNSGSTIYNIDLGNLTNGYYQIQVRYLTPFTVLGDNTSFETHLSVDRLDNSAGHQYKDFYQYEDIILGAFFAFDVSANIPEIKVIDFLTGIFKMFNLTAFFNTDGIVEVMTLDDFYSSASTHDLTQYIESSEATVKPSKIYKLIEFKYKGQKTYLAKSHKEAFNSEWGTEEYAIDEKFDGQKYQIEIPFGHMKFERLINADTETNTSIQWGWSIKDISESGDANSVVPMPLIFYAINNSGDNIVIKKEAGTETISNYFIPSNSVGLTSSQTIHFKAELNEYAQTAFTETLFQTYYSNYIIDVFKEKSRLFSFSAYLPLKVLLELRLNDVIIISGDRFRVNSMTTDLQTGKTQFELKNLL